MTPQQQAEQIRHEIRMILMDSDTDYGEEILVTKLVNDLSIWHLENKFNKQGLMPSYYWGEVMNILKSKK